MVLDGRTLVAAVRVVDADVRAVVAGRETDALRWLAALPERCDT